MKKILLTGSAGTIGTSIQNHFASKYKFKSFDIAHSPLQNVAYKPILLQAMRGCDIVIHTAGIPHPDLGTAQEHYNTNIGGTKNILETVVKLGVKKLIYISSITVNGIFNQPV